MTEVLRVVQPGLFTTIQDIGRPQAMAAGVPAGGAMDRFAHSAANLLVGNERGAATLECTLSGPRMVAEQDCLIAITGADFEPRVNGASVPMWTGVSLAAGAELTFGGRRSGARSYVAVAGGVAGDRWLGSMSTNLMCARGGMHGRALIAGDVISVQSSTFPLIAARSMDDQLRPRYEDRTLHTIVGPHFTRLQAESRQAMFEATYTLSHDSNRMGYRLEGPRLDAPGDELLSFGLVAGVVQLPSGGQPILLMADHQTAGGYPIVATVASASMPVAAQLAPGDEVRFAEISLEAALELRANQRAALESLTT
ncbi:MAG: biotin-dependent carboxyltransferase [Chloroflexi bacterium]|nr:MAG: biotin-dependent carboxyltransferase [Chloroflexota bacterium]